MTNVLKRLADSKKLPLGHYERTIAQEMVNKEYAECREIENKSWKRFMKKRQPRYIDDLELYSATVQVESV